MKNSSVVQFFFQKVIIGDQCRPPVAEETHSKSWIKDRQDLW